MARKEQRMNITEFLLARIAEDEELADRSMQYGDKGAALLSFGSPESPPILVMHPTRILAECKAKREIIKLHEEWPVLVEGNPETETVNSNFDNISLRITQQIMWTTERAYLAKFGTTPPTAPMISSLAAVYADHPDYQQEWKH